MKEKTLTLTKEMAVKNDKKCRRKKSNEMAEAQLARGFLENLKRISQFIKKIRGVDSDHRVGFGRV